MNEDHVNFKQGIQELQEKVEDYKNTLMTLKNESSLDERIKKTEQLIDTIHHEQNTKLQKYEEEISMLSIQLDTLNHTVFELTEKMTAVMNTIGQEKQPSKTSGTFPSVPKHSPMRGIPSFKQLRNLLTETQAIELEKSDVMTGPPQTDTRRQNSHSPRPTTKMPNLNNPSAQKRFSVKATSMDNAPTHLNVSDRPHQETINEIEVTSTKEPAIPKQKQLLEEHQPNNEQVIESPTKTNKPSTLLNFFRKN